MSISALPKLYSEDEAKDYLGVSKPTMSRLRRRKALSFMKVGSKIKYTERHLLDYLESQQCLASKSPTSTDWSNTPAQKTGISNGARAGSNSAAQRALTILQPPE